jgi:hypothetical protein
MVAAFGSVTTPEMVPVNVCDKSSGMATIANINAWSFFMVLDPT